ncbi:hypothetical protein [Roseovarius amoyensis]|uniref:hypothetical protein n=1 Tax=Roseovarius amoyensis TaxID=2211448 RepID=UPI000DBE0344|nr:hypothetical protein [Roseovarius amoyensis]
MNSKTTGEIPELPVIAEGREISRNEIMDVLADQGYSANARKEWLKCVLTRLSAQEGRSPRPTRAGLIDEVEKILQDDMQKAGGAQTPQGKTS